MVTKKRSTSERAKGKVRVGKLKLNKETVRKLTGTEEKQIKGGKGPISISACWCTATLDGAVSCRNCV